MKIEDVMLEVGKQKLDFIQICDDLNLSKVDLAVFSQISDPSHVLALGITIGKLHEQQRWASKFESTNPV